MIRKALRRFVRRFPFLGAYATASEKERVDATTPERPLLGSYATAPEKRRAGDQVVRRQSVPMGPLMRRVDHASKCLEVVDRVRADVYVAHDALPLTSACVLADATGGHVFCNAVEIPTYTGRVIKTTWAPAVLETIDAATDGHMRRCKRLLTVSEALASELGDYNVPVSVIPNYRNYEAPPPNSPLRQAFGIPHDHFVILMLSTISVGFEEIIGALEELPEDTHVICIGKFVPSDYNERCQSLVADQNLSDRVHFHDPVPYADLTSWVSGADCGVFVASNEVTNHTVALPNRIFDYLAGGIPFVSSDVPDISAMAEQFNCGVIVKSDWKNALIEIRENIAELKAQANIAAKALSWESLEPEVLAAFDGYKSVTFVGLVNLTHNNRTVRMARTLAKNGIQVNIVSTITTDIPDLGEKINIVALPA